MNGRRLLHFLAALLFGLALVGLVVPQPSQAQSLNELLRRQAELRRQADENKRKIEQKQREASNLQGTIADLDDDISYTEGQISNTQSQIETTTAVITELNVEIEQWQNQLNELNERLRVAYIALYELSRTSTVESILQSASLTNLVSQTQYVQAIQTELQRNIEKANTLKSELETKKQTAEAQKAGLDALNQTLNNSRSSLQRKRNQKDYLLQQTQGEQAKYEALLRRLEAQQEILSQEIYEARRRAGAGETITGGSGGYPWAGEPNPYAVDPWLFYKRQCTSYVAWKFWSFYGLDFYNTRPGQGSAWNWPNLARDQGYRTSSAPRVNAIVSWPIGTNMPYGHAAWVTAVNGDGTINVTEYNWVVERGYSERRNVTPGRYGPPTYIYP